MLEMPGWLQHGLDLDQGPACDRVGDSESSRQLRGQQDAVTQAVQLPPTVLEVAVPQVAQAAEGGLRGRSRLVAARKGVPQLDEEGAPHLDRPAGKRLR